MIFDGFVNQLPDTDPGETSEWLDSLDAVIEVHGKSRARFLLSKLLERASEAQVSFPATVTTPYINTIPRESEPWFPGDEHIERRIRRFIRWNAAVTVVRANKQADGIGGHLSTFASSASLYEIGFNHFFRGKDDGTAGDHVYFQGHAAPGVYARAFLERRLEESDLESFRREIGRGGKGLSSYPHPRLMPEFWEFPTVSMGLGPITALYQARFNRYMLNRELDDTSQSRVWAFLGDGECDEPETLGAISLASREKLDNLVFVVNCNLQRLDGPVRGNGKIIQELEATFRGAGWNVIKVIHGSKWDALLAKDKDGVLLNKMNTTVDGQYQRYGVEKGAYIRDNFFGPDPRLRQMVAHLEDTDLENLPRGGHDYRKLYAAYKAATENLGSGAPTVILAKTIKGWTLGPGIEARNATHQIKKMTSEQLIAMRDRLHLQDEIPDNAFANGNIPYYRPGEDTIEYQYMMERRRALGGSIPKRIIRQRKVLNQPTDSTFEELRKGSGEQEVSTTMGFTRLLRNLARDENIGQYVVPIIPDEGRTFGMDSLFPALKIYASQGQKYEPVDHDLLLSYSESTKGQILEEGINEAGAMASFIAAGTAYATRGVPTIPFYTFYSMFGFQRVGDLIWQAADARTRGFLMGATAGRTTLPGEGLQHQDGHSLVLANTVPPCQAYDPAFAYEVATIVQAGIQRMYSADTPAELRDVFYYITLYNENYQMPAMPEGLQPSDVIRGLYRWKAAEGDFQRRATLLFSGSAQGAARAAAQELAEQHGIGVDLWSATSYKALRDEALSSERWNRLHPSQTARVPVVAQLLADTPGPVVAVTDFMKVVPEQVARFLPGRTFLPLGTDGMGRSDTREALRRYFEVDAGHVVVGVLSALAADGLCGAEEIEAAIARHGINPEADDPLAV
ncbi:MAG: pyruvate dehydrogenase (acetyl-transferring), homodimeric type [Actinobacteria bacterium]|uniref:Pyruvate dehydrogenase E1 component n=3 Tax=freshwater metagenome TaxID=449393 RepID=A0A6J6A523_9ZZZZ|nr:pyruvate dehydrogenase (acetyl-transferring), homodimeric type [Actinomycetota bacterium]MSX56463.1 pyruvate dehydrogenase (acetyl-transferring), homodimeric type [Actinomycetota bacterium]MSZ81944.1 pyruvate dehydrogenase (acetyl-transferring), homodimeric type [Actinomycetota bacterium]MTB16783.1 pyruvate dehydrogenase (acetyl-transferring), homodimeric type [Actinomycetota bacterium]